MNPFKYPLLSSTEEVTFKKPCTWIKIKVMCGTCMLMYLRACQWKGVYVWRGCVREWINQILTVSERDRGHRSSAFRRLSLYLLWQFPRCSGPPGHCVCLCLPVYLSLLKSFPFLECFILKKSRTDYISLQESTSSLLTNQSAELLLIQQRH